MSAFSFALLAGLSGVALGAINNPLGPYSVSDVTVSGLSAGAYMAVQMHVAYSSVVNGSAIFAGVSIFLKVYACNYSLFILLTRAHSTAPRAT